MEKEAESCGHQDKEIGITQTLRQNEQIAIYINEGEKDRKKWVSKKKKTEPLRKWPWGKRQSGNSGSRRGSWRVRGRWKKILMAKTNSTSLLTQTSSLLVHHTAPFSLTPGVRYPTFNNLLALMHTCNDCTDLKYSRKTYRKEFLKSSLPLKSRQSRTFL